MGVSNTPVWINAHENALACLAFNEQATKIATASIQGTLIRVWDVATKNQLIELRRGSDAATIYWLVVLNEFCSLTIKVFFFSLNFNRNSEFLCCSSDKGTIHIFAVQEPTRNKSSKIKL